MSMEFTKQEYSSRLPLSSPGDLSDSGIESRFLSLLYWHSSPLPLALPGKALISCKAVMHSPTGYQKYGKSKKAKL